MKSLRIFVVAMLGLMLVAGLVACGGSSSDSSGSSSYTASGTYTYIPSSATTGELTVIIETSTYPTSNCEPGVKEGEDHFDVIDLSANAMTWVDQSDPLDDMTWTGSNSGGIIGTWYLSYQGTTYFTLVITDTAVTVTSPTSVCSIP